MDGTNHPHMVGLLVVFPHSAKHVSSIYRTGTYPAWTFIMNVIPTHLKNTHTHKTLCQSEKKGADRKEQHHATISSLIKTICKLFLNHDKTTIAPQFSPSSPAVCPPPFLPRLVFLSHEFEAQAMRRLLAHHHLAVRQAAEGLKQ